MGRKLEESKDHGHHLIWTFKMGTANMTIPVNEVTVDKLNLARKTYSKEFLKTEKKKEKNI